MSHGTGKERFVERLEQIAAAGRVGDDRQRVVAGDARGGLDHGPLQCRRPGRDRPAERFAAPGIGHPQGGEQVAAFDRFDQRGGRRPVCPGSSPASGDFLPRCSRDDVAHQQLHQEHVPRLQGEQHDLGPRGIVRDAVVPGQPIQAGLGPRPVLAAGLAEEGRPLFQRCLRACSPAGGRSPRPGRERPRASARPCRRSR